ncbi:unnamed protein product [Heligmosomoides polygyrus]|uniref:Serine carboxypeptidase S28 n=1 Tax=Heligmosomoides polygyrus TaxID=6339 RepID=A0A3P8A2H4_HELPZ|nr:unnamed protein product [Heligmosomoides polygyrus]
MPKFHLGRPMYGLKIHHERLTMLEMNDAEPQNPQNGFGASEGYFTQKLDHFDDNSTATWSQRYFFNFQYQIAGSNVVFLMLGGEGPESINWVQNENYPFVGWAKERGAALFDLEHRFYGQSRPTADQSVANLRFLSSRQAIEDIATFIRAMNVRYRSGLAKSTQILSQEQLEAQRPCKLKSIFGVEYLQVVEESLRSYSEDCAENVRIGFAQMIDMMNTEVGRTQLSELFVLDPPFANLSLTYNDIQNFYSTIYGNFQGAVQYSGDNAGAYANGFGISNVCSIMNNGGVDQLTALQNVNFYMAAMYGGFKSTDNSYDDMISYLRQEQFGNDQNFDSGARSWTWQTCTEFGYFQTTDGGPSGIFGSVTPLTLFINMCRDTFGSEYDADYVDRAVRSTLDYYGGADGYNGTNVIIPNGSLDPWHALGKYTSSDPSVVWYLIEGTAHCADMYPPRESDAAGLTVVRKLIGQNIDLWLSKNPSPFAPGSKSVKTWAKSDVGHSLGAVKEANRSTFHRRSQSSLEALPNWRKFRKVHLGRPPHGFRPAPEMDVSNTPLEYETGFFTQPVDHFNAQNPNMFKQVCLLCCKNNV